MLPELIIAIREASIVTAPPHRRKPNRLPGHDYREPGAYFVTLCVDDHRCRFGDVVDAEMIPNEIGRMVLWEWHALQPAVAGIALDAVMLMPDHLHGIIVLGADPDVPSWPSLGRIVSRFKGISDNQYRARAGQGIWQPIGRRLWQQNYYDRVIRNDRELDRIREYIADNPRRWEERRRGQV